MLMGGVVVPGMIVRTVIMGPMVMRAAAIGSNRVLPLTGRHRRLLRGLNVIMHDADTAVSGIPVTLSQE